MRSKIINKKDVKQIFWEKNPPKFTTRRKYIMNIRLTDQSLQSAPKTFGYGTVGWFQVFKKCHVFFFGGKLWRWFLPTFSCVEPFFWAYLELISSQLHQIQWFRRLFLRISMSQVDQAPQNQTSADSQHEKQLWWDWGKHNAKKLIPSRKHVEGLISILQSSNCEQKMVH